jgi:hypothetical protein
MAAEDSEETRTILVSRSGSEPDFMIRIPINAKTTFAPFSPPSRDGYARTPDQLAGTLRIYRTEKDIIAVFSQVTGFRDIDMEYTEKVTTITREETVWKNDKGEFETTAKARREEEWLEDDVPQLGE